MVLTHDLDFRAILAATQVPPKDVAKNLGVSIPTLYRHIPASASA